MPTSTRQYHPFLQKSNANSKLPNGAMWASTLTQTWKAYRKFRRGGRLCPPRVYLKTHDVTGSEGFLRCARHFFAGILTYFKEKWRGAPLKGPLSGCVGSFQIHPSTQKKSWSKWPVCFRASLFKIYEGKMKKCISLLARLWYQGDIKKLRG